MKYPVAEFFWSIQGEAHLRGFQMAFLRLGGCSVGCPECDTNYKTAEIMNLDDICAKLHLLIPSCVDPWVWITGGEPSDHDLRPLLDRLGRFPWSVAIASAGTRRIIPRVDWLSISPHAPGFVQRYGNEIKLVDGLGGMSLSQWKDEIKTTQFMYRYVQPLSVNGKEDQASLENCLGFLKDNPSWALSRQDHLAWRVR